MEEYILMNEEGDYRGPKESQKLREEILKNYKERDKEGRNKIDATFDNQVSTYTQSDGFRKSGMPMFPNILLDPNYDKTIKEKKHRVFLYIGDELGHIKLWDLTYILTTSGYGPLSLTHRDIKGKNYFPNRVESVEIASAVTDTLRKDTRRAKVNEIPDAVDPLKTRIQIREVKGHRDNLNNLTVLAQFGTIASCSADYTVRLWSPGFDLWGTLK